MILQYGIHRGRPGWGERETVPSGFSRIYLVSGGEGYYRDDREERTFLPGRIYLLPTSVPYNYSQDHSNPFRCTYIHYDFFPGEFSRLVEINPEDHPLLLMLWNTIDYCLVNCDIPPFKALAETFTVYCTEHELIPFTQDQMTPVLEYIAAHLSGDLSIEALSARAGYNSQYFIRLFKEKMGVTPHRYIINYRMKEARRLLTTDLPITQVAFRTGFGEVKTFSRSFRKNVGLSPTLFRKTRRTEA